MSSSRSLVSTWGPTSATRTTQKPSTTSWPFPTTTEEWEEAIVSLISSISPFQLPIWFSMVISSLCRHRLRQEQRRWPLVPFRWLQCNSNGRGNCCGNAISLFLGKTCRPLLMLTLPFFADQSRLRALLSEARRHNQLSVSAICSVWSSTRH